jgi:hypothetical protein
MLHDWVTALRTANIYERHSYRHIVGLPVMGEAADDGLAAERPFLVARIMRDGQTDLFATGVYIDRIHDEAVACASQSVLFFATASRFDTLLAIRFE